MATEGPSQRRGEEAQEEMVTVCLEIWDLMLLDHTVGNWYEQLVKALTELGLKQLSLSLFGSTHLLPTSSKIK